MDPRDYRRSGLFEDGFLKGMALSVPFHMAAVLLALAAAWLMPPREIEPPVCLVTLLNMQAPGGGAGMDGAMSNGKGKQALPPPAPAASVEPKKTDAMPVAEMEKEAIPRVPVPMKTEKSIKKPKPKPLHRPPKKEKIITKAEESVPPPPAAPMAADSEARNPSDASLFGQGKGLGREEGDGEQGNNTKSGLGSGIKGGNGQEGDTMGFGGGNGDDPGFITKVLPKYPWMARKLGKEGTVVLLITICEKGRLLEAEVVKSAGSGFDEEALAAIKSSTFRPARRNGKPIRCKASLPIVFKLRK